MTEEQKRKAEEALMLRLPMYQNFEKEIAFRNHQTAIEWIEQYGLPYRISLDYLKEYDHSKGFICINPNYPYPGYLKADLIHLDPYNDCIPYDPDKEPDENGYHELFLSPKDAATRQKIREHNKALRPWNLSTPKGLERWKYYFAHLLNGADLDSYSSFDWFGVKAAAYNKEQENKIYFWKCLQADYYMNPNNYLQKEPKESDYNLADYISLEFVPDWKESATDSRL